MTEYNPLQAVKRRFFAMRNGIVADTLRRGGSSFRIIFGLNLPQLVDISHEFKGDSELARQLWENRSTRESMLLAPMLMDAGLVSCDNAVALLGQAPDTEVADVLCHKLLRHSECAIEASERAAGSVRAITRYGAVRLAINVLDRDASRAVTVARSLLGDGNVAVRRVALQLLDEADFRGVLQAVSEDSFRPL